MTTQLAVLGFGTMGQAITGGLVEAAGFPPGAIVATDKGKGARARAQALG
ncbi:MAG: hypothetical protein HGA66_08790, partial [Holophaga sp.]|nr:hypothetical protein [Holophaga sp.]